MEWEGDTHNARESRPVQPDGFCLQTVYRPSAYAPSSKHSHLQSTTSKLKQARTSNNQQRCSILIFTLVELRKNFVNPQMRVTETEASNNLFVSTTVCCFHYWGQLFILILQVVQSPPVTYVLLKHLLRTRHRTPIPIGRTIFCLRMTSQCSHEI